MNIDCVTEHRDHQKSQCPRLDRKRGQTETAEDERTGTKDTGNADTGRVQLKDEKTDSDEEEQVRHRRTGERVHPTVEHRQLGETDRRHRHTDRFVTARVDLSLKARQLERKERKGRRVTIGQTHRDHALFIDGVVLNGVGRSKKLRGQQLCGDNQLTGVAEVGANSHSQLIDRTQELSDLALGARAARTNPGIDRDVGIGDPLSQLDESLIAYHRTGAVDLEDDSTRTRVLGSFDRTFEIVSNDAVEESRHLNDIEDQRVKGFLGMPSRSGTGRRHGR